MSMRSARCAALVQDARSWRLEFELPAALMRFVAPKGSICINGVSLTVNEVEGRRFDVNIIPHTSRSRRWASLSWAIESTSKST